MSRVAGMQWVLGNGVRRGPSHRAHPSGGASGRRCIGSPVHRVAGTSGRRYIGSPVHRVAGTSGRRYIGSPVLASADIAAAGNQLALARASEAGLAGCEVDGRAAAGAEGARRISGVRKPILRIDQSQTEVGRIVLSQSTKCVLRGVT